MKTKILRDRNRKKITFCVWKKYVQNERENCKFIVGGEMKSQKQKNKGR